MFGPYPALWSARSHLDPAPAGTGLCICTDSPKCWLLSLLLKHAMPLLPQHPYTPPATLYYYLTCYWSVDQEKRWGQILGRLMFFANQRPLHLVQERGRCQLWNSAESRNSRLSWSLTEIPIPNLKIPRHSTLSGLRNSTFSGAPEPS